MLVVAVCGVAVGPPGLHAQAKLPEPVTLKGAIARKAHAFGVTQRVDQLPPETPGAKSLVELTPEKTRAIRNPRVRGSNPTGDGSEWTDLALQALAPEPTMPAPSASFDGLSSQDNSNSFGFRVSPPDTNGAVGPSHYVQQTNMLVRVYTKAGVAVTAPFPLSSLFASAGVCGTDDNGDPIVMYDALADRWILSQFGFTGSGNTPPYHECIAVSQTSNPAGAYYAYDFVTPGIEFPDYPHLGVWPDAYYMTVNQFANSGPFDGSGAYAFDRAKMLAGDPSASFLYFNLDLASHPEGVGGMLPSWVDGLRPPPAGSPNVFVYFLATEFGDAMDGLRLFSFHANFTNPANSTFIERPESPLRVAAFDPLVSRVPQPGTTATLDTLSDRLMHRLQYRNTGSAETLVVTHTVDADPTSAARAGIRYYELRRTGGVYSVFEQATYAPGSTHRWMGSAAEDNQGNLAVGFSAGSSSVFPSVRFAGRLAGDAPGGLMQGESTLVAGTGVQTSTGHRWGDYSALTVDPVDDCTFWFTTEYYTLASQGTSPVGWLTRIGAFKFAGCTAPARGSFAVTVTSCSASAPLAGASVTVDGVLYAVTNASGQVSVKVIPGTYAVAATANGATGSQSASVAAGGTENVAICVGCSSCNVYGTRGDFTGDGKSDLLWRGTGGDLWLWAMNGGTRLSEPYVGTVSDPNWQIRSVGDQDGDGKADLLWRHAGTGALYFWRMEGGVVAADLYVGTVPIAYDIVGTGDYDGDGKTDLLWRHTTQGDLWLWRMDGATKLGEDYVGTVDPAYVVRGSGDLDGDGRADLLWQHATQGDLWAWLMNGGTRLSEPYVGTVSDLGYEVSAVADLTGDGKADIVWRHATQGDVWLWEMDGGTRVSEPYVGTVDPNYRIVAAGDYDGDVKADLLWRHVANGDMWMWLMDGATRRSDTYVGTVPVGYQIVK